MLYMTWSMNRMELVGMLKFNMEGNMGKTGTSQNPHGDHHSSFLGYMTTETGKIFTLYIIVENGGKGSEIASSLARDIFNYYANSQSAIAVND